MNTVLAGVNMNLNELLVTAVTTIVASLTPFVVSALRKWGNAATAAAAKNSADRKLSVLKRLEGVVLNGAANIAEKQFPILGQMVLNRQVRTSSEVRQILGQWGQELKNEVVSHFSADDIDIVAEVGESYLDRMIESAANKFSPLPGMKTSAAILTENVAHALVHKGVEYVKENAFDLAGTLPMGMYVQKFPVASPKAA
jgi:hypothetical protein